MVALPSVSPHTQRTQPGQPIDLPHRTSGDKVSNSPLAPNTEPSQATAFQTSTSNQSPPPAQSEQQQQATDDDDAATEDTAAYSPLLKDHVFALYCAGQRSPAIAAQLGIPERTARHWIRSTLQQLAQDDVTANPEAARQQRALAIESQRAASASAWETYHRLTAAHNQLLDLALMSTIRQDAPQADPEAATREQQRLFTTASRLATAAARYLSIVIHANREIAHLQGQAITQDARERQATAARDAADARQLEADLIRAFTTPILPPEPAPRPASPYASSWPGGITTPQSRPAANVQPLPPVAAAQAAPHIEKAAKTATPLAVAQAAQQPGLPAKTATPSALPQSEKAAKTATATTPIAAVPILSPLPVPGAAARATVEAEQLQSTAREQGERSETLPKTKIAAKTATPTSHAVSKSSQPRHLASAKRKPQLILPSQQRPIAHPAT